MMGGVIFYIKESIHADKIKLEKEVDSDDAI